MKLENLVKAILTNTKESEGREKAEVKEVIRRACIQEYWTKTGKFQAPLRVLW